MRIKPLPTSLLHGEMNRLGLKGEPAPQPQHTLLSSPKNAAPTVGLEPTLREPTIRITTLPSGRPE